MTKARITPADIPALRKRHQAAPTTDGAHPVDPVSPAAPTAIAEAAAPEAVDPEPQVKATGPRPAPPPRRA